MKQEEEKHLSTQILFRFFKFQVVLMVPWLLLDTVQPRKQSTYAAFFIDFVLLRVVLKLYTKGASRSGEQS